MPTNQLPKNLGRREGARRQHSATVSAADGDTYDTGLNTVEQSNAEAKGNNAGTSVNLATVASTSGGVLTFDVASLAPAGGNSSQTTAQTVDVIAVGE